MTEEVFELTDKGALLLDTFEIMEELGYEPSEDELIEVINSRDNASIKDGSGI